MAATDIPEEDLQHLINDVLDWQYIHDSLLKIPPDTGHILARPIGVALFPSPFPQHLFEAAMSLQLIHNKLYIAVTRDEPWLHQTLRNLISSDPLVSILWRIHEQVKNDTRHVEPVSMAFFRSDYMLHIPRGERGQKQLKQVELNTFSVAGGVHSARISQMHEYFNKIGSYETLRPPHSYAVFPPNPASDCFVHALRGAHTRYGPPKSLNVKRTAILMIVQPNNVNICDERPIEEMLWQHDTPTFRIEFGEPVLDTTILAPSNALLLYHPTRGLFEISVVYYRAGYDETEYGAAGIAARIRLEQSRAVKCPSILTHLAGSKKVQQELAMPGVLERFLSPEESVKIRETFMPMYPLDDSDAAATGRELALNSVTAENHVLKPSKDGGGHNIYGSAIPGYLQSVPQELWPNYILMEKIRQPSDIHNSLISFRGVHTGPVVSELGIFGICMWEEDEVDGFKVEEQWKGAFSFKSKASHVDEMSVVKGYGSFDSPWLV